MTAALKRPLEDQPHLRNQVVIVFVCARSGDLHPACENHRGVFRLPLLAPDHVERFRCHEVLHLAVERSFVEEVGVVLNVKPGMRACMNLRRDVQLHAPSLLGNLAGWQESAHLPKQRKAAEGFAGGNRGAIEGSEHLVLVNARSEGVIKNGRHGKISMFGIARGDAVLDLRAGIAESILI